MTWHVAHPYWWANFARGKGPRSGQDFCVGEAGPLKPNVAPHSGRRPPPSPGGRCRVPLEGAADDLSQNGYGQITSLSLPLLLACLIGVWAPEGTLGPKAYPRNGPQVSLLVSVAPLSLSLSLCVSVDARKMASCMLNVALDSKVAGATAVSSPQGDSIFT